MDRRIPDAAIRRAWLDQSMTTAEAARAVGLTRSNLWLRARKLGLPARPQGRREVIPREVLAPLWAANVRAKDIAQLYGCYFRTVSQSARRYGLPPRPMGTNRLITLDEYRQSLLGRVMKRQAEADAAARKNPAFGDKI